MPLPAGTTLDTYEILAPLGAGGMGEVYAARDAKLDRRVAVKVLPREMAGDEAHLRRIGHLDVPGRESVSGRTTRNRT